MADRKADETPKAGGRPRSAEPGATVSSWLPASEHDRLIRLANQRDTSVSALVRTLLTANLPR